MNRNKPTVQFQWSTSVLAIATSGYLNLNLNVLKLNTIFNKSVPHSP